VANDHQAQVRVDFDPNPFAQAFALERILSNSGLTDDGEIAVLKAGHPRDLAGLILLQA
jgi:hypothetical protein